jgi:hypothetical protein
MFQDMPQSRDSQLAQLGDLSRTPVDGACRTRAYESSHSWVVWRFAGATHGMAAQTPSHGFAEGPRLRSEHRPKQVRRRIVSGIVCIPCGLIADVCTSQSEMNLSGGVAVLDLHWSTCV